MVEVFSYFWWRAQPVLWAIGFWVFLYLFLFLSFKLWKTNVNMLSIGVISFLSLLVVLFFSFLLEGCFDPYLDQIHFGYFYFLSIDLLCLAALNASFFRRHLKISYWRAFISFLITLLLAFMLSVFLWSVLIKISYPYDIVR